MFFFYFFFQYSRLKKFPLCPSNCMNIKEDILFCISNISNIIHIFFHSSQQTIINWYLHVLQPASKERGKYCLRVIKVENITLRITRNAEKKTIFTLVLTSDAQQLKCFICIIFYLYRDLFQQVKIAFYVQNDFF